VKKEIVIGNRGGNAVVLEVGAHDGDGMSVEIEVQVDSFRGKARSWTVSGTFRALAQELRAMMSDLNGSARAGLTDGELSLEFFGDGKGHINVHGVLKNFVETPRAELKFEFAIDQTYLATVVRELEKAETE
jgi:hypothetical protein